MIQPHSRDLSAREAQPRGNIYPPDSDERLTRLGYSNLGFMVSCTYRQNSVRFIRDLRIAGFNLTRNDPSESDFAYKRRKTRAHDDGRYWLWMRRRK